MEDAFLCAKHAVTLLQSKLVELRAKAANPGLSQTAQKQISRTVAAYLSQLQQVHTAVRDFLLQLAAEPEATSAASELLKILQAVAEEVPGLNALEEGRPEELAVQVRQHRAAKREDDICALRAAVAALPFGTPARPEALEAVVRNLSNQEQSLDFHIRLAAEVSERFGGGSSYSIENFAYGSTPYTSWLEVLAAAGPELKDAMAAPGREYVVWGSSCGWLVLYGALTYAWRSRGVELLSCLHECAQRTAAEQAAELSGTAGVHFTCGDLLQDDVSTAGLVVLADQCWDERLAAAAAAKLGRELPTGALCVSYSGTAFRGPAAGARAGGGGEGAEGGPAAVPEPLYGGVFEEAAAVRAPVSWADGLTFRIFRKL
ncbi:hypothetical protein PLESTM_000887500 [Pleodorina starrii]|nr:hypothetical protein PLESTM_000887500 [Pleodorina starrii]